MYDRNVNGQELTFCVSGKLWNRSLVMLDTETESLWSHLLGEAMDGQLKGARLDAIPGDLVTWKAWRDAYPKTTVLNMSRTKREYSKEFYKDPASFVIGFRGKRDLHHCSMATLKEQPVLNIDAQSVPLLITFDVSSTSALLFRRDIDGQLLTFVAASDGKLRDEQTGSLWERTTGKAVSGPLSGKQLVAHLGILSYTKAWLNFHPSSLEVK